MTETERAEGIGRDSLEDLLRDLAPQVLGALVRRYGRFDVAEDAVQEALLAAATQWPADGTPREPRTWLIRVASRRMVDQLRSDQARRRREEEAVASATDVRRHQLAADDAAGDDAAGDDSLLLLFLCCHPQLSPPSQVALTLRAVGGLTTTEIASALLLPEPTLGQRISRAKQQIKHVGGTFTLPSPADREDRLAAVLKVLYLIFNEGYTVTSGTDLVRVDLTAEAIRLTRLLRRLVPDHRETMGLLALMLLTEARRPARTEADGVLVPLPEQDRSLWDRAAIEEGTEIVTAAMRAKPLGPYQLQAAIAALHAEAPDDERTDWPQILALYELLHRLDDSPAVALNRAIAAAMVHGATTGLGLLDRLQGNSGLSRSHRVDAARAHLYEMAGETDRAADHYAAAARRTSNHAERRYLERRLAGLRGDARQA